MSDHLTEAARHLRAAIDHLILHDVDDVATQQATIDMMGELRRTRLFYLMKSMGKTAEEFAEHTSSAARAYGISLSELSE